VKPAVKFDPPDKHVETGRLLIHDLARIVLDSAITAGKFTIRQTYNCAKRYIWLP